MARSVDVGKAILKTVRFASGGPLRPLLDIAIEGYEKLPGARKAAAGHLKRTGDHEAAIDALVLQHIAMAGAQGFITNVGGLITAVVAIPANMAGAAFIQCRMIAGIAHLRGYDLSDNRVRSAILLSMLGEKQTKALVEKGELPSTPLGIATAPVFDSALDQKIAEHVANSILASVTGKRLGVFVTKRIPVVGGGVGLAVDSWATKTMARESRKQFPSRRPA